MSEEEKKEYEEAKLYLEHTGIDDFNLEKHQCENRKWAIDKILNLIEKQFKEIEELKKGLIKRVRYCNELEKDLFENCNNYVISKSKIKAKIEELENMYNKLPKNPKEHLHSRTEYKIVIGELQSLLEEE